MAIDSVRDTQKGGNHIRSPKYCKFLWSMGIGRKEGNVLFNDAFGVRCSSVVRAFAHGAMGCRIDPSWGGPIELFLVPASAP